MHVHIDTYTHTLHIPEDAVGVQKSSANNKLEYVNNTCIYAYIEIQTCICIHTDIHTYMHAHINPCIHYTRTRR